MTLWEEEKMLVTEHFLPFPQCFYSIKGRHNGSDMYVHVYEHLNIVSQQILDSHKLNEFAYNNFRCGKNWRKAYRYGDKEKMLRDREVLNFFFVLNVAMVRTLGSK